MLRILFGGDVSLTGVYREQVECGGEIFDDAILDLFRAHDYAVINLEGPATSAPKITRGGEYVVSPPETIPYLAARGIKVFNCGNNHIFDCGLEGFTATVEAIERAEGRAFGAGLAGADAKKPLLLSAAGINVALISICHFRNQAAATDASPGMFYDSSLDVVKQVVDGARSQADYVILNYHGGEEYTTIPMPSRREALRQYAELGIDMIVAHHSHVVQGHEKHAGCEIFYSLGNFVFDVDILRRRAFTDFGAVLSVSLKTDGLSFELIPVEFDLKHGRIVPGPRAFFDHIRAISNFSNYAQLWRRDAFRTYFQRGRAVQNAEPHLAARSRKRSGLWSYALKPKSYVTVYRQLRNEAVRPILVAAIREGFSRIFNRSKQES